MRLAPLHEMAERLCRKLFTTAHLERVLAAALRFHFLTMFLRFMVLHPPQGERDPSAKSSAQATRRPSPDHLVQPLPSFLPKLHKMLPRVPDAGLLEHTKP